jgi:hypothetical protein
VLLSLQPSVYRLRLHYQALTHDLQQDESVKQYYLRRCHQLTEAEHRRPPTGKQVNLYRRLSYDPVFSMEEQDDLLRQLPRLNFHTISDHLQALIQEIRFRNRI